jgi:hypothetical protein
MQSKAGRDVLWSRCMICTAALVFVLLYEDYVWVSLRNAMKAKQSKACTAPCTGAGTPTSGRGCT